MKKFHNQMNNEGGFTLIELAIVVAIIATLLAGLKIVPSILASNRANQDIATIPKIMADVQAHYFNKANFTGLDNTIVNSFKMVPSEMNQGGSTISNRWAGAVTIAPATTTIADDSFTIDYAGVPSDECMKIVEGVADNFLTILVGGTEVKAIAAAVDDSALATQCNADTQTNITFTASK